ncbi:MAG: hypothetical protein KA508_05275 [Gammaproteobacteria bacterium]|nr:hypothetical protein [Gammaproteobacteria bacterium]
MLRLHTLKSAALGPEKRLFGYWDFASDYDWALFLDIQLILVRAFELS